MGALTIAFDTTVVGALALPWVVLVVHLFFFDGQNRIDQALRWIKDQQAQAAAGVLLFAMTYTLGSAVSRIAQDCFNDDDLHLRIFGLSIVRDVVTENRILTRVYCESDSNFLLPEEKSNVALSWKIAQFREQSCLCTQAHASWVRVKAKGGDLADAAQPVVAEVTAVPASAGPSGAASSNAGSPCKASENPTDESQLSEEEQERRKEERFIKSAADILGLQENALMEKGQDYSVRLRQLHDQVMVLRGAAFNGVLGLSLSLFAWEAVLRRKKPGSWVRWAFVALPAFYIFVGVIATRHHFADGFPPDPPYMEFTLFLLAAVGGWSLIRPLAPASTAEEHRGTAASSCLPEKHWLRIILLSAALTIGAFLGWWSTEMLYAQQVIYSYDTQGATAPQK
jgi:hypothetical protein